jgi:serine/threonine protein kinase
LTDFGISKLASDAANQTATGMILGTPEYMSPEQASGAPDLDGRSDLYSLGLVGYAMVSGRPPFQGRTPGESIARRLVEDAPRLAGRGPVLGSDFV